MADDHLYIRASREVRCRDGAERDEALWREALVQAGGYEIEARNHYVTRRVEQLRKEGGGEASAAPLSSVRNHPDYISVARYAARNNVDERHVIQSIRDGQYVGREVAGDWYIYTGKSSFKTHEERKHSFFFDNANETAESGDSGEERDNLVPLRRPPE